MSRSGHATGTTTPRRTRRGRRAGAFAVLAVLALVAVACKPDSGSIGAVRDASGAFIAIDHANSAGGMMGVDILLGPDEYNPCHLQYDDQDGSPYNDRYYGACQDSSLDRVSYFRHMTYTSGGPELKGVLFGNWEINQCKGQGWCPDTGFILPTDFARKATAWALEFYPFASTEGGVRITGRFDIPGIFGIYNSGIVGAMNPVIEGEPGSFRLVGNIAGGPWADGRFQVEAFQMPPLTKTTSAGWPEEGFSVTPSAGGAFRSWPMIGGTYKIYVRDTATGGGTIVYRNLGPGSRIDINPAARCYGLAGGLDINTEQRIC